ncbi:LysR family transcriptional regulator [Alishewanella longhuensis]
MLQYPDTELEVHLTNDKLDLVQGGYDLAIRLGTLEDSSLIARKLTHRTQYIVASPSICASMVRPTSLAISPSNNA